MEDKIKEVETKFDEIKKELAELDQVKNGKLQELLRLQGEYRLLKSMDKLKDNKK